MTDVGWLIIGTFAGPTGVLVGAGIVIGKSWVVHEAGVLVLPRAAAGRCRACDLNRAEGPPHLAARPRRRAFATSGPSSS